MMPGKYAFNIFSMMVALCCFLVAPQAAATIGAEGAGPWLNGDAWQARLIYRKQSDTSWKVGLQMRLDRDWKTYWRRAGGNGFDPVFSLAGSSPHHGGDFQFPTPKVEPDPFGYLSIYYEKSVVFPVEMEFQGPEQKIQLQLHFGVCNTLCLPQELTLTADLAKARMGRRIARYLDGAWDSLPKDMGVLSATITREGEMVSLPMQTNADALLEIGGQTVIAQKADGKWVFTLPRRYRKKNQQARLWQLGKDHGFYSVTLP